MGNELLESDVQRLLALNSFFGGAGYKIFKKELNNILLGAKDQIESTQKSGFISESGLNRLNFLLGQKFAIEKVFFVLEDLQDELQERNSPATAQDSEQ